MAQITPQQAGGVNVVAFLDMLACPKGRTTASSGPKTVAMERWAKQRKIRVQYDGQGGVWTTTTALNQALGVDPQK